MNDKEKGLEEQIVELKKEISNLRIKVDQNREYTTKLKIQLEKLDSPKQSNFEVVFENTKKTVDKIEKKEKKDIKTFMDNFKKLGQKNLEGWKECNNCELYRECDHQGAYKKDDKWCYEDLKPSEPIKPSIGVFDLDKPTYQQKIHESIEKTEPEKDSEKKKIYH